MSKTPKRPRDTNQLAKYIVELATTELPQKLESQKAASGRLGGLIGGKARSESLDAESRSEIARHAATIRWKKAN